MERLLLECAVRTVLIAAATAVVLWVMRIQTASARHASWTAVVLLMLVLPAWRAWGPTAIVRALPPAPAPTSTATLTPADAASALASPPLTSNWQVYLLGVYLAGAAWLLMRLAIGTIRAQRLTSASCIAPITVGLLRPRIILPEGSSAWPQAQLDAVLTHEGAHVRRRDPLVQWLALFNRAVFWFHPLAWWLERRLTALAEEACDTAVLERGHDAHDYSGYLLEMARSVKRAGMRVNAVGMAMPGSFLSQRVRKIMDGVRAPKISRARMAITVAACAIPAVVFAAGAIERAPNITPPPPPKLLFAQAPAGTPTPPPKLLLAQAPAASPTAPPPTPSPVAPRPESGPFPIAMDVDYTQLNRAEYAVHFAVKIPASVLDLARKQGAQQTSIDFIGVVTDAFGTTVTNIRDKVNLVVPDVSSPIQYDARVTLLPGRYIIRLVARDNETAVVGTYEAPFVIPNLNKQQ